jgi:hypothetical protein
MLLPGRLINFSVMTNGPDISAVELPAQALGWLDPLAQTMPETLTVEFSSWLVIALLLALWIWRRQGGGRF